MRLISAVRFVPAACMLSLLSAPVWAQDTWAITGVTLFDGTGEAAVAGANVVVRGERIVCAGTAEACPVPDDADRQAMDGRWVLPGLIDAHVHFSQSGFVDARPDALGWRDPAAHAVAQADLRANPERFQWAYLCSGITSVFDVGGYPWTWDLREAGESAADSPRILASGPLVSTLDHWLNVAGERQFLFADSADAARRHVDYLAANGTDAIKLWFIVAGQAPFDALETIAAATGAAAAEHGVPFIVHATGLREAKAALRAGAGVLVHSVDDQPVDDEFLQLLVDAGAVYVPTLTVVRGYTDLAAAAAAGRAHEIDDPGQCVDANTRDKIADLPEFITREGIVPPSRNEVAARRAQTDRLDAIMRDNLRRVAEAGAWVAAGTDAGNPLTLHGASMVEELEAMHEAGLTAEEVLVMATRNGARALGRDAELGTVEAGKLADLIVLGSDPTEDLLNLRDLEWVVKGGHRHHAASLREEPR